MARPKGISTTEEWKQAMSERMRGDKNPRANRPPDKWHLGDLPDAVKKARSWTELHVLLGLKRSGGTTVKKWVNKLELSTAHFTGEWMSQYKVSDEEVFRENSKHYHAAKKRFYARTPDVCMDCGQAPFWNGRALRFEVDHKNGNSADCRWDNLKKLCPNCHSQTDTYCGRNHISTDESRPIVNGDTIWCNACRQWLNPDAFGEKGVPPTKSRHTARNVTNSAIYEAKRNLLYL